jgi:hypothetical protein
MAPSGRYELVRPFAMVTMSGMMSPCSKANILPVRPKPHMTSSQISRMPYLSSSARRPLSQPVGRREDAVGAVTVSMIIAAIVPAPS